MKTIVDRLFDLGWEYPEILADLDELTPDRSGPSERAEEVLALDCGSVVGRLCHVLIDEIESIRPDYWPPLLDVLLAHAGVKLPRPACVQSAAVHAMFVWLHG